LLDNVRELSYWAVVTSAEKHGPEQIAAAINANVAFMRNQWDLAPARVLRNEIALINYPRLRPPKMVNNNDTFRIAISSDETYWL
jgi:hypothetical protein